MTDLPDPENLITVTINDGKYTVRQVALGQWEVLRNGEPWPAFEGIGPDNLHVALAMEVHALQARVEALQVFADKASDSVIVKRIERFKAIDGQIVDTMPDEESK